MKLISKNKNGFTLIELLIVIAIIGILASVVMSALNSARMNARNAARISQMRQVQKALEMYYDDHGEYPDNTYGSYRADCAGGVGTDTNLVIPSLIPEYISEISADPNRNPPVWGSCTSYRSDGVDYAFRIFNFLEPTSVYARFDPNVYKAFIDPHEDGTPDCVVDVNNPGALNAIKVYTEGACDW